MNELIIRNEYIMYLSAYEDDKLSNFYKGTFRGVHRIQDKYIFVDVIQRKSEPMGHSNHCSMIRSDMVFFPKDVYTFHNITTVKENGKKAIQNMEKRALDKILKILVNEHFEWL